MSRVLLAGDTHGDRRQVIYLLDRATEHGCNRIVQVGDFGYWPHIEPFDSFVAGAATSAGVEFYWLDGNHENFDALQEAVDMAAPGPQRMADGLWYLSRGCTWEWDGVTFMAFGGAHSVDRQWRTEGHSWWRQELPTKAQQDRALGACRDTGRLDVLLTHDAPNGVCPIVSDDYKGDETSRTNRQWITVLADRAKPRLHVHGHYHRRYTAMRGACRVEGLDRDGSGEKSYLVLDLAHFAVEAAA